MKKYNIFENAISELEIHLDDRGRSILIIEGSMEYWYKNLDDNLPAQFVVAVEGDVITSDNNEIHAMKMLEDNTRFIAFTEGVRGGKNYESDTFRVEKSIII